jgi:alpha-L-fucosidase
VFGEGPAQETGGQFSERKAKVYTPQDIRFTTKGRIVYATLLEWPEKQAVVKSLGPAKVHKVTMLGVDQPLKFSRVGDALTVDMPDRRPGEYAYVLKIA